jgi:hypothetical protein
MIMKFQERLNKATKEICTDNMLNAIRKTLLNYFDDVQIRDESDNICTIFFSKNGVKNNRIWFKEEQAMDIRNWYGRIIHQKGVLVKKTIPFGRNTYATNYQQFLLVLNKLESGESLYLDETMTTLINL